MAVAAVKVGPWGAPIGQQHHDIPAGSMPQSLVSITISSSMDIHGGAIHGFAFVYVDQNGDRIPVGPWGTIHAEQRPKEIVMDPDEYLYELSGIANDTTLFWLKLVTNKREYTAGNPVKPEPTFRVPLGNRKVVGFFGRSSDDTIKELGIYVSPVKVGPCDGEPVNINTLVQLVKRVAAVKVGPWGAPIGQQHHDIPAGSMPQSLVSITISSSMDIHGGAIHGFAFVYVDQNGDRIPVGPWGTIHAEQRPKEIVMDPDEYLYELSGIANDTTLFWLKLVTNKREYTAGNPVKPEPTFSVPLGNRKVVGFFGRSSDDTIKELGIYVPVTRGSPVEVGPWVGEPVNINTPVQLKRVTVYSIQGNGGGRISGLSFTYIDLNGQEIAMGPRGPINGQENNFELNPGEYVKDITGTFDKDGVTSLQFTTNQDVVYGPFGTVTGTAFSVPLPKEEDGRADKGAVVGFFGRFGDGLVALGVYVGLPPNPKP